VCMRRHRASALAPVDESDWMSVDVAGLIVYPFNSAQLTRVGRNGIWGFLEYGRSVRECT
jgi:hypothetical protein